MWFVSKYVYVFDFKRAKIQKHGKWCVTSSIALEYFERTFLGDENEHSCTSAHLHHEETVLQFISWNNMTVRHLLYTSSDTKKRKSIVPSDPKFVKEMQHVWSSFLPRNVVTV